MPEFVAPEITPKQGPLGSPDSLLTSLIENATTLTEARQVYDHWLEVTEIGGSE